MLKPNAFETKSMMKGVFMKKSLVSIAVVLVLASLMIMACSKAEKGPAELAVKAAEEAVNVAKTEVGKIAPDEVAALENALASAKDKFSKGDFKEALAEAQALAGKAKDVVAAAKAKAESAKAAAEELTKKWSELSQGLPKMVEVIQSRVDILSKAKKLPAGLTAEKLAEAKSGLAAAKDDWAKAQESFKAGNLADAVSVATAVKEKAVKAMEALGMTVPAAAK